MNILDDNRFSKVSFFILFLIIIIISYKIVAPFILSIVAGALLAQLLRPLQNSLIKKNVNPTLSAYLIFIFFFFTFRYSQRFFGIWINLPFFIYSNYWIRSSMGGRNDISYFKGYRTADYFHDHYRNNIRCCR